MNNSMLTTVVLLSLLDIWIQEKESVSVLDNVILSAISK